MQNWSFSSQTAQNQKREDTNYQYHEWKRQQATISKIKWTVMEHNEQLYINKFYKLEVDKFLNNCKLSTLTQ